MTLTLTLVRTGIHWQMLEFFECHCHCHWVVRGLLEQLQAFYGVCSCDVRHCSLFIVVGLGCDFNEFHPFFFPRFQGSDGGCWRDPRGSCILLSKYTLWSQACSFENQHKPHAQQRSPPRAKIPKTAPQAISHTSCVLSGRAVARICRISGTLICGHDASRVTPPARAPQRVSLDCAHPFVPQCVFLCNPVDVCLFKSSVPLDCICSFGLQVVLSTRDQQDVSPTPHGQTCCHHGTLCSTQRCPSPNWCVRWSRHAARGVDQWSGTFQRQRWGFNSSHKTAV